MLNINLGKVFKARGIEQPYKFLVKEGFVPFTAHKLKNNKVEHIRVEHIEKICISLNCTPNDIFEWSPNDLLDDRKDHPLQKLRKQSKKIELRKMLEKMSLEKMDELEKMINTLG